MRLSCYLKLALTSTSALAIEMYFNLQPIKQQPMAPNKFLSTLIVRLINQHCSNKLLLIIRKKTLPVIVSIHIPIHLLIFTFQHAAAVSFDSEKKRSKRKLGEIVISLICLHSQLLLDR